MTVRVAIGCAALALAFGVASGASAAAGMVTAILAGLIILSFATRSHFEHLEEFTPAEMPVRQDCVLIEGSSMRGLRPEDRHYGGPRWGSGIQLLLGHRISPGDRTVLAWRAYYDNPARNDDEGFEFLTIELTGPVSQGTFAIPSPSARAFYSRGSSTWGLGEYSSEVTGEVEVGLTGTRFATRVVVRLNIRPFDPHKGGEVHDLIRLEKRMNVGRHPVANLFPWLRGTSPTPQGRDLTEASTPQGK